MSQKKRMLERKRREEALKKAERNQAIGRVIGVVFIVLVIAIIAGALIFDASKKAEKELNYSIGLNEQGKIKGVKAEKYVELADFNALNMNKSDYYPTEAEEDTYINAITESYPNLSDKKGVEVKEKDTVSVDYVGRIDGKEYEGGNTNGMGIRVTLGTGTYPTEFENGIIGHKTGETFDVSVPFRTDFENEELAGKIVVYTITLNGVYETAEFNDEFVLKNFGYSVESAEDFLNKYRLSAAQTKFDQYVQDYAISESKVKSYPLSYLSKMKTFMKAKDYKQMETTNSTYQNLYQKDAYKDVLDMRKMTKKEYKEEIKKSAREQAEKNLIYQALFEKFDLSVSQEDLNALILTLGFEEGEYDQAVERFGEPYLYQQAMIKDVNNYLAENYNLIDN
ncbi:MAG: FKBP-type peptidyl-prolyl cis-trans isomerase [Lachnospiraceae bacterium]|nr:FKBP-type peptidyl-prolyl cis-trans isomerase [Lachnospiraceae bacterium]